MLSKFDAFPELGQLSVFGTEPEWEKGEIWGRHGGMQTVKNGKMIYVADANVATSCIIRREIWDKGLKWRTRTIIREDIRFPRDYEFSMNVKKMGYVVAWNDRNVVFNWGHNIQEFVRDPDYYIANREAKPRRGGLEDFRKTLRCYGYDIIQENGKNRIVKIS